MIPNHDITYAGWAPCAHEDDEKTAIRIWARQALGFEPEWPDPEEGFGDVAIWQLTRDPFHVTFDFASDHWVRVTTDGRIGDKTAHCEIDADTFWMALVETYRWWKEQWETLQNPT